MLESFSKEQKLEILELLDDLCVGAEHAEYDPDDWSGLNGKYSLDSEAFRANIRSKIQEVERED